MTGKSEVIWIVASLFKHKIVIFAPTTSLCRQLFTEAKKRQISCWGSGDYAEEKILILTPDVAVKNNFAVVLSQIQIAAIFIDEAHLICQWEEFKGCYSLLKLVIQKCRSACHLLSATLSDIDLNLVCHRLEVTMDTIVRTCSFNPLIDLLIGSGYDNDSIVEVAQQMPLTFPGRGIISIKIYKGIIYCLTKAECDSIFSLLETSKKQLYYGGLNLDVQKRNQENWMNELGSTMVATTAFGYGIDADVAWVIIYRMPDTIQDLVQMIGRVGRSPGFRCSALLAFSKDDHESNPFY